MKLLFLLLALIFLASACSLFEEEQPITVDDQIPSPELWKPDTSQSLLLRGIIRDDSGNSLSGVVIAADYTVNCDESNCPYYERVEAVSDDNGEYQLMLYEYFWDVQVYKKTYSRGEFHISREETFGKGILERDIVLNKGVLKTMQGYVRDQGSRMILDKPEGNFGIFMNGKTSYFRYLVIINDPESEMYQQLKSKNNRFVSVEGYVSLSGTLAEIDVTTIT